MTILSKKLETLDYTQPYWNHIYNKNMDLLENDLLKLNAILEIEITSLRDGDILEWDETEGAWIPRQRVTTTTTTTTTTI